jgi:hypothetical protein
MSRVKNVLITVGAILLLLQLFQPKRNTDLHDSENELSAIYDMPGDVKAILQTSCYDCHSNSTRYPWYSYVQPFGWWLSHHIREGKAELNFSEFGKYAPRRQQSKLKAMVESVKSDDMPLPTYTVLHPNAKLTALEKKLVTTWIDSTRDSLAVSK